MKAFHISLALSILLLVGGFLSPPMGVIDGSVLSAAGLLFAFATLAQVPQFIEAVKDGKSIKVTRGNMTAEVSAASKTEVSEVSSPDKLEPT